MSISSDNQSLLKAFQSGAHDTKSIRQRHYNRKDPNILIWATGHKGIPDADELAKAAANGVEERKIQEVEPFKSVNL